MFEVFATLTAPESLVSGVNSEMLKEKGFLAEGLATLPALKRPSLSVHSRKINEAGFLLKCFAKFTATVRLLRSMNLKVMCKVGSGHI